MVSPKPWTPEAILQLLVGVFACVSLGVLLVALAIPGGQAAQGEWKMAGLLINSACLQGGGIILFRYFLKQHSIGWKEAFGFNSPGLAKVPVLAVLATIASVPMAWFLNDVSRSLMTYLNTEPETQQAVQALQSAQSPREQLYFGFVAILFAPLIEEILFRGIIYPYIKQIGYPRVALWGTSFAFALVHFNVASFIPLACFAVVLTALYEQTNNLLTPILTHSLFNITNFLWLVNEPEINQIIYGQ
jgi:membrane protease YdiL (CAAX protease family)